MEELETRNLEKLKKYLAECTLFLKKDGSFPLKDVREIAAYGNGVRHTIKGGTGSGEVNSRFFVTVEEGLEKNGYTLINKKWLDAYDQIYEKARDQFNKEIFAEARRKLTLPVLVSMGKVMLEPDYELELDYSGEAAIYVLSRVCGEGNDRQAKPGDFFLSSSELRDIRLLNEHYEKFMLVLNTGGPIDLSPLTDVRNILILSQLGVETGEVLSDIISGKAYPSGKLTTTWAAYADYCKKGDFGNWEDIRYREGIYVGYRYFNTIGKKPLYPFGFGLSYADFRFSYQSITHDSSKISVRVLVENISKYPGKEVIQLYVSSPKGRLDKPYQALTAYRKSQELKPGEKETLTLTFDLRDLASYDRERAEYVLEKGNYILRVGTDSENTKQCARLTLPEEICVRKTANKLGETDFADLVLNRDFAIADDLDEIIISRDDIRTQVVSFEDDEQIEELVKEINDNGLALLNVGAFNSKGLYSIIGNSSMSVAGAAGESSNIIREIPNLVLADGPAGLRLSKFYYTDKKGVHSLGPALQEDIVKYLPRLVRMAVNKERKLSKDIFIHEQYATAIPIGTAIAQSFNDEFARICGDIVGSEMERFNVDIWLAPALNIHRHVLCGRNYEYFSEDPYLSGMMAASICQGVQQHPGKGVTIKHFAANNQELNRMNSNSIVSERALREIYLKGFELCIDRAQPEAVMSSYNLINGIHTSENKELCIDVLRHEFGFKGLLMTDWIVMPKLMSYHARYPSPDAAKVAASSHSLFMPGSNRDYKEILKGLKNGTVSKERLQKNASILYRTANGIRKNKQK